MRQLFDELARSRLAQQQLDRLGNSSTPVAPTVRDADPMQPPSRTNPGAVVGARNNAMSTYLSPAVAFGHLRAVISQPKTAVVAIVDLGHCIEALVSSATANCNGKLCGGRSPEGTSRTRKMCSDSCELILAWRSQASCRVNVAEEGKGMGLGKG